MASSGRSSATSRRSCSGEQKNSTYAFWYTNPPPPPQPKTVVHLRFWDSLSCQGKTSDDEYHDGEFELWHTPRLPWFNGATLVATAEHGCYRTEVMA